ncbi:unnamed protein product (mitochondrion) [Plasmodiophora brassicae]|uniref:Uncharacterized protein n=2 Tax=Plasmodiophora brassicae TaxID=37360 RepID=A0A3P3YLL5_PLABS|nr:unnamed protein product [Plasmodiophora brassicae]
MKYSVEVQRLERLEDHRVRLFKRIGQIRRNKHRVSLSTAIVRETALGKLHHFRKQSQPGMTNIITEWKQQKTVPSRPQLIAFEALLDQVADRGAGPTRVLHRAARLHDRKRTTSQNGQALGAWQQQQRRRRRRRAQHGVGMRTRFHGLSAQSGSLCGKKEGLARAGPGPWTPGAQAPWSPGLAVVGPSFGLFYGLPVDRRAMAAAGSSSHVVLLSCILLVTVGVKCAAGHDEGYLTLQDYANNNPAAKPILQEIDDFLTTEQGSITVINEVPCPLVSWW